jgi:hypothetical protein
MVNSSINISRTASIPMLVRSQQHGYLHGHTNISFFKTPYFRPPKCRNTTHINCTYLCRHSEHRYQFVPTWLLRYHGFLESIFCKLCSRTAKNVTYILDIFARWIKTLSLPDIGPGVESCASGSGRIWNYFEVSIRICT